MEREEKTKSGEVILLCPRTFRVLKKRRYFSEDERKKIIQHWKDNADNHFLIIQIKPDVK